MKLSSKPHPVWVAIALTVTACSAPEQSATEQPITAQAQERANSNEITDRSVFFGDLHVHTFFSLDAFIFGTRATPDDAYNYAKGAAIEHPAGFEVQLDRPLDFYAVTDHAMFLGMLPAMADSTTAVSKLDFARPFNEARTVDERRAAFQSIRPYLAPGQAEHILDKNVVKSAWQEIQAAAARHNAPGQFTTFVAYEYTSGPDSQNLHRNVIFRGAAAPDIPWSRLDSQNPETLWAWMDDLRDEGIESLAIPHNSNGSNGQMFKPVTFDDRRFDAEYAEVRARNEPLVEVTQVKGTSEAHPLLSPNDEWADFEIFPYRIATFIDSNPDGSYARQALGRGLEFQANQGFNPFSFGFVGASDTHTAAASLDESNYFSKVGQLDATGELRGSIPLAQPDAAGNEYANTYYNLWGASGVTGVWADENSRSAIYDAFRRKETFATTGPRIRVRMFGGLNLPVDLIDDGMGGSRGYEIGVPMGGELRPADGTPSFVIQAMQDANSAPLQRIQIIKSWVENGSSREAVFDAACSDGLSVDPTNHRCPDNGASVDIATCVISVDTGAAELSAYWVDPAFNPDQHALYYARVLENPTCRWSTWDAIRAGVSPRDGLKTTIQERAYTSPIWYRPAP